MPKNEPSPQAIQALKIELIVWHHKRCTRRQPYSAAAYLLDPSKPYRHQVIEAGSYTDAGTEGEAAAEGTNLHRGMLSGISRSGVSAWWGRMMLSWCGR